LLHDRGRDFDEPAKNGFLANDSRVVFDVCRRRHGVDEKADVILAARRLELTLPTQFIRQRERIHHAATFGDVDHRPEDPAMSLGVEHRVVHMFDRAHHRVLVDQHRREYGLFCVLGVRRTTIAIWITRQRRYREFDGRA
jgi:hypothetical protein